MAGAAKWLPLSVLTSRDFVKPGVYPLPDITLGSWNRQVNLLGYGLEVLRFEFFGESVPECLQQQWLLGLASYDLRG